jgi:hypothetical protein
MEIKVLGLGHVKDYLTTETISQVVTEKNIDTQVEKITGCKNIGVFGISLTPSVIIDGEIKCTGRIPTKEEVRGWIKNIKKKETQDEPGQSE